MKNIDRIHQLERGWGDDPTNEPFDEKLLQSVEIFVNSILFKVNIDAPLITPDDDGSIDIYWKTNDLELLINISLDWINASGRKLDVKHAEILTVMLGHADRPWLDYNGESYDELKASIIPWVKGKCKKN